MERAHLFLRTTRTQDRHGGRHADAGDEANRRAGTWLPDALAARRRDAKLFLRQYAVKQPTRKEPFRLTLNCNLQRSPVTGRGDNCIAPVYLVVANATRKNHELSGFPLDGRDASRSQHEAANILHKFLRVTNSGNPFGAT